MLINYRITEKELKEYVGIDLEEDLVDTTKKPFILNIAFEYVVKEIFSLNDNIKSRQEIEASLDSEEKIYVFKWCQAKVISNLFSYKNVIIDDTIIDSIRFELKLSKINGFQK